MSTWLVMERSLHGVASPHTARIESAGRHFPATSLTTEELMASTRRRRRIELERLTGIHERRVSAGDDDSLSLPVPAAQNCLVRSSYGPADLDVGINCHITKFGYTAGFVAALAEVVCHGRLAGGPALFVCAGAGITAGAVLYDPAEGELQ